MSAPTDTPEPETTDQQCLQCGCDLLDGEAEFCCDDCEDAYHEDMEA